MSPVNKKIYKDLSEKQTRLKNKLKHHQRRLQDIYDRLNQSAIPRDGGTSWYVPLEIVKCLPGILRVIGETSREIQDNKLTLRHLSIDGELF